MPTITSIPVQVASDPQYRMNSEELGPFVFEIGSNLYQVLVAAQDLTGTHTIGVFKRATSDVNGTWQHLDAAHEPNPGNQIGSVQAAYNPVTGRLAVLYVSGASATGFKLCELFLPGDTWLTPGPEMTVALDAYTFAFCAMATGAYKVLYSTAAALFVATNSAGIWSSNINLLAATTQVLGGVVDASDNIYFIINEASFDIGLRVLNAANSLSAATLIHVGVHFASSGRGPNIVLWPAADAVAVGYFPSSGPFAGNAVVSILTPLAAPVNTNYNIFTTGATDDVTYINPVVSRDGLTLNAFFGHTDVTTTPLIDEIRQSVFDGASSWSASTLYYDAITNPPTNGSTGVNQFVHAMQPIELPQGWSMAATMETDNGSPPPTRWCTGFFMDPAPPVSQTLQLNKEVVGGSLSAADFTLTATGEDSPATIVTGPGPQVGPTAVPAITFDLSEAFGPTWNDATGTWASNSTPWDGGYVASAWVCTGGGTMPDDHTIIIPAGANIVCTITNTAPIPPIPPQPGSPCGGPITPQPQTDVQFELRRVYTSMKPAPRIPVRGS